MCSRGSEREERLVMGETKASRRANVMHYLNVLGPSHLDVTVTRLDMFVVRLVFHS